MTSSLDATPVTGDILFQHLVTKARAVLEGMLLVEYRLATVAALIERFGTRHVERAATELQAAVEQLTIQDKQRHAEVAALTAALSLPTSSTFAELTDLALPAVGAVLRQVRAEMISTKGRIEALEARAEDLLGRRIALVAEVLASTTEAEPTYGRQIRPRPRFVDGLL